MAPSFRPPGRRRFRGSNRLYGGQPLALPLVAAVGSNNITATGASLVGTINPQGLSGTYWFTYGTTPQMGTTTTVVALTAGTIPQTVTITLSGLTTGTTYYWAVVASTAAGTVTSPPQSFVPAVPQAVTDASAPLTPVGAPLVAVPHFNYPLSISATLGANVVEQDTLEEVFANVQTIVACTQGTVPELPDFGVPDLTFSQAPIDGQSLVSAIQLLEPRASEQVLSQQLPGDTTGGARQIALTTEYAGSER